MLSHCREGLPGHRNDQRFLFSTPAALRAPAFATPHAPGLGLHRKRIQHNQELFAVLRTVRPGGPYNFDYVKCASFDVTGKPVYLLNTLIPVTLKNEYFSFTKNDSRRSQEV